MSKIKLYVHLRSPDYIFYENYNTSYFIYRRGRSTIASNSNTNVLATPQLLVQDNTEGVFEVGETVPVPQQSTTGSTVTTSQGREKISLKLKITPQINKVTRFIKMKIDQQIDDFSSRSLPSGLASQGVATTIRATQTTVTVRDRDTIAMGGLMRDKTVESVELFLVEARGISLTNIVVLVS